ncbi:MAG: hypothetical protein AAB373_03900 [Patescibacteria group bacterium]
MSAHPPESHGHHDEHAPAPAGDHGHDHAPAHGAQEAHNDAAVADAAKHGEHHDEHATTAHAKTAHPEAAHGAAPAAHADAAHPTPATETIRDKSPIAAARDWVWGQIDGVMNGIKGGFNSFRSFLYKAKAPVKHEGLITNAVSAVGNVIDGTIGNVLRRATDIIEPIGEGAAAVVDATLGTTLHVEEIFTEPGKTFFKKPARILTSGLNTGARIIQTPANALDDAVETGVDRTIDNGRETLGSVWVAGGLLKAASTPAKWVSSIASGISSQVKKVFDAITSPVENMHLATSPA